MEQSKNIDTLETYQRAIEGRPSSLLHSFIYGWGAMKHTNCSKSCAVPPSTVYASGHILVVLRQSPAKITSSSLICLQRIYNF